MLQQPHRRLLMVLPCKIGREDVALSTVEAKVNQYSKEETRNFFVWISCVLSLFHVRGCCEGPSCIIKWKTHWYGVPTPNVAVIGLTCRIEKNASYEDVKAAIKLAVQQVVAISEDYYSSEGYWTGHERFYWIFTTVPSPHSQLRQYKQSNGEVHAFSTSPNALLWPWQCIKLHSKSDKMQSISCHF